MANSMLTAVREAAADANDAGPITPAPAVAPAAAAVLPTADADRAAARSEGVKEGMSSAAAIVEICATAGMSATMALSFLNAGVSAAQAQTRVDGAKEIKAHVEMVRKTCPAIAADQADRYIDAGMSAEEAGRDLLTKMAALQSPEIVASHQAAPTQPASAAWDKAVAGVNSRFSGPAAG